jgi:uncharacterized protein (TIGR02145 family)
MKTILSFLSGRAAALSPEGHFIARSAFILLLWCIPAMLAAEGNGVKVSNLLVSTGSPTTVTFDVSWSKTGMPTLWSDTVWVWVDYNNNGVMERLPVISATASAGAVKKEPNNNKGVWVIGNARTASAGSFSATVQLLTATADVAGACAYASNYPPVGEYSSDAPMLSFTGTPMYEIQLTKSGGGSAIVKSGSTFLLPCDYTSASFTDATGAPGRLNGVPFNDNVSVPQYAASAKTWKVSNQIWSDYINDPACGNTTLTSSTTNPYCRSYASGTNTWYYYNWPYVNANKDRLCPSPWHVPTMNEFAALDLNIGGDGQSHSENAQWMNEHYVALWGANFAPGWFSSGASPSNPGTHDIYWSVESYDSSNAQYFRLQTPGIITLHRDGLFYMSKTYGYHVRCVR